MIFSPVLFVSMCHYNNILQWIKSLYWRILPVNLNVLIRQVGKFKGGMDQFDCLWHLLRMWINIVKTTKRLVAWSI